MPQGSLHDMLVRADQRKHSLRPLALHCIAILAQITIGTSVGLGIATGLAHAVGAF